MKLKLKFKIFYITSIFFVIVFLFFSVFQISSLSSEIKLAQAYEKKIEIINKKNEDLIINSVEKNSLNSIKELTKYFDFVEIETIYHIREPLLVEVRRFE